MEINIVNLYSKVLNLTSLVKELSPEQSILSTILLIIEFKYIRTINSYLLNTIFYIGEYAFSR